MVNLPNRNKTTAAQAARQRARHVVELRLIVRVNAERIPDAAKQYVNGLISLGEFLGTIAAHAQAYEALTATDALYKTCHNPEV